MSDEKDKNSAFWDAVHGGKGEELVPTRPSVRSRDQAGEARPGADPYADVEEAQVEAVSTADAISGLPQDVQVGDRKRKLLIFVSVPVLLLLAIIIVAGGSDEKKVVQPPAVTETTFEAVPIAPESPIKRDDTPRDIVAKAKESLIEQYGGKRLPPSVQMAAFLEEQLKLEVTDKPTQKTRVLKLTLLPTGRVLLSYKDTNGLASISAVNLDQAPDS